MSHTDPPAVARCPRCGSTLSARGGICLRCLALDGTGKEDAPLAEIDPGFSAGRCVGDYELLQEVGRGGMGVVFKARQKRLDRVVASKVLRAGWLAHAGEMARFRSEARTVEGLHHQNIVAIHEVGEHDGQPYFSMDFVAGSRLEEIARGHPLPSARAARYVRLIAGAIQYAHEHGVLHRDLKPSNVRIDGDDQPRVTDFGLAKRLEGDAGLTLTGQVLGSPNFMPPEQASAAMAEIGPASDVYSLGALFYYPLTGRPPFLSETITDTLRQVAEKVAQGRDTALLRDMLDQTAKRLDTEFRNQPEVEAQLRLVVAQAYLSLQLGEAGARHARMAWNLRRQSLADTHPDALEAELLLAELLETSDKWKESNELANDALQHCRRQFGNRDLRTCRALHLLGNALKRGHEYPAAIAALREVLEIEKAVPGNDSTRLFAAMEALGCALIESGRPVEAGVVFESWLRAAPPASLTNSLDAALAKGWLGTALQRQRKFDQADALQGESLELRRRLLPRDHPAIGWHLFYWAGGFEARANFAEAQAMLTEAWSIAEQHSTESLHLKHVLAFYGRDWIQTWAKTEPSAVALAAAWQDRLTQLQRQHPELPIAP